MAPPRPPSIMMRAASCVAKNMLMRLISTWRRMLASGWVTKRPARTPPALLIRMSRRPKCPYVWLTASKLDGIHRVGNDPERITAHLPDG